MLPYCCSMFCVLFIGVGAVVCHIWFAERKMKKEMEEASATGLLTTDVSSLNLPEE